MWPPLPLVQTGSLELTDLAITNLSDLLECDRWITYQVLPSPHKYFQWAPYQVDRCDKSKEFGKCSICHARLTVVMANRIWHWARHERGHKIEECNNNGHPCLAKEVKRWQWSTKYVWSADTHKKKHSKFLDLTRYWLENSGFWLDEDSWAQLLFLFDGVKHLVLQWPTGKYLYVLVYNSTWQIHILSFTLVDTPSSVFWNYNYWVSNLLVFRAVCVAPFQRRVEFWHPSMIEKKMCNTFWQGN